MARARETRIAEAGDDTPGPARRVPRPGLRRPGDEEAVDALTAEIALLRARLSEAEQEVALVRRDRSRLVEALDHIPEALVLLDAQDRFVYWNKRYADLYIHAADGVAEGSPFEDLLRAGLRRGEYIGAAGREEVWLAERMQRHARAVNSHEQQHADGSWVRVDHRRLTDGSCIGLRTDITALKAREASFKLLFDANPVAMIVVDRDTLGVAAANDRAVAMYGCDRSGLLALTLHDLCRVVSPDQVEQDPAALFDSDAPDRVWRHAKADGSPLMVRLSATQLVHQGRAAALCAVVDVSTLLRVEGELTQARTLLDCIVESIPLAIFAKDVQRDGAYVIYNRAAEEIGGRPRSEVIGRNDIEVFGAADGERYREQDREILATGLTRTIEETCLWGRATKRVFTRKMPITDGRDGPPRYVLGIQEDVTEQRRIEDRMRHMAHHDPLTDLPNRALFRQNLQACLTAFQEKGIGFAVHSIDLDRFKEVNDSLGHAAGDMLLARVAERISLSVRPSDRIARLGGDEFAILQSPVATLAEATQFARRLVERLRAPYRLLGEIAEIGASVGVALASDTLDDADAILRQADLSLYQAKRSGLTRVCAFEEGLGASILAHRTLEQDLRRAVVSGDFDLHYQPMFSFASDAITGFEALLRWTHPQRGPIPPLEFLPLAEELGLIETIGAWVLERACAEAASWPPGFRVAVNLSPLQVQSGGLAAVVFGRPRPLGPRPAPPRTRDHGIGPAGRQRNVPVDPQPAARRRHQPVARRFRYRLFLAQLSPPPSLRPDQDRPQLRPRHGREPRLPRDRAGRGRPQREPGYPYDRRGGRDRRAVAAARPGGLRRDPGLPVEPPGAGRLARPAAARRGDYAARHPGSRLSSRYPAARRIAAKAASARSRATSCSTMGRG